MYLLVRRTTGKVNKKVSTRAQAREYKRSNGFRHDIVRSRDGLIIR